MPYIDYDIILRMMESTIAAIATPPGQGGIAIIRISGPDAQSIANSIASKNVLSMKSHRAYYTSIIDIHGTHIDEALVLPMLAPHSYTGENTIEIQCHGGLIASKVLERTLEAGAKLASPGEFTYRAFRNGKIDLAQAEAVQSLIGAQNDYALNAASQQLTGHLSKAVEALQSNLAHVAAILEAWVDFPEEGLEFASMDEVIEQLEATKVDMMRLKNTFRDGKIIHNGLSLCLIGAPNVGKSSLLNLLLGKERAIVTSMPGTTRDHLEDDLHIAGLHLKLIDTAGLRDTDDTIEQEGIRRSYTALKNSDLTLVILDTTRLLNATERQLLKDVNPANTLIVWNKLDINDQAPEKVDFPHQVFVSAKKGIGLNHLKQAIEKLAWSDGAPPKHEVVLTQNRHYEALNQAVAHLNTLIQGLSTDISPEFLASDMRATLLELSRIRGTDVTEDVLSAIFANFCVGK